MNTYLPSLDMGLPVHLLTEGATVYRMDLPQGGAKYLVVAYTGKEVWCSPDTWAEFYAKAIKLPTPDPQLTLF
jgi:hypothetical protein